MSVTQQKNVPGKKENNRKNTSYPRLLLWHEYYHTNVIHHERPVVPVDLSRSDVITAKHLARNTPNRGKSLRKELIIIVYYYNYYAIGRALQ